MRLASSAFLRRAAAMSSSSYGRRGGYPRPRRGYSARPSPPPHGAGAELVSGDFHHSAVRAANESLRRGGGGGPLPPYRHGPQPHQPHYGYGYSYGYGYGPPQHPAPAYGAVPYNYSHPQPPPPGPQYGYGAPHPYFHGHPQPQTHGRAPVGAGFRPRLAEYRRWWRFARQQPPRQAGNIFQNW